jgi:taurine dioxygenase
MDQVIATTDPAAGLAHRRTRVGDVDVGPYEHLAAERARLAQLRWKAFEVRRLGATLGAELSGVDLTTELPDSVIDEIRRALHEYKVVFFRDQPLTVAQHVAFARRFGELEVHPFIPANTGEPSLVRFEKSADVAGYENSWHHDVTWREIPSMAAVLHGIEVPDCGGDTLFSDMCAAYDGLTDDVKEQIDELDAVHDFMRSFGRQIPPEQRDEMRARYPLAVHPVAPRHHATGRRYLYVNQNFTSHIVGIEAAASRALLDHLTRQASALEHQCRFHWTPHAVAFWDNHAVQHYAASDYWPDVRIMERASIVGARPTR